MKNWKVWVLKNKEGQVIAQGRKKEVANIAYQRYVYGHIFTDTLIQTNELLVK